MVGLKFIQNTHVEDEGSWLWHIRQFLIFKFLRQDLKWVTKAGLEFTTVLLLPSVEIIDMYCYYVWLQLS